jgi:hypothetical protein
MHNARIYAAEVGIPSSKQARIPKGKRAKGKRAKGKRARGKRAKGKIDKDNNGQSQ